MVIRSNWQVNICPLQNFSTYIRMYSVCMYVLCVYVPVCMYVCIYVCMYVSLSTVVLNSKDRQGMYGMQHFRAPRNPPYKRV